MTSKEEINLTVSAKNGLFGTLEVPVSKSYAHRILIACALADKPTKVIGKLIGQDILSTILCLTSLGAKFESFKDGETMVYPIEKTESLPLVLDVGESGSTLRFMLPLVAALGESARFKGSGRINKRPISDLIDSITSNGASVDGSALPFNIKGKIKPGEYRISGEISSQYITGLLLALPLLDGASRIVIDGETVSQGYLDITLDVLNKFGINPEKLRNEYIIKETERYISPGEISVEGDWSSACFFAVGAALSGDVKIIGLNPLSKQGDRVVMDLLKEAGAKVEPFSKGVRFSRGELQAINFSAKNYPDIVPVISVMLSRAKGNSVITNIERLRLKESDRLSAILEILRVFGVDAENLEDSIVIKGGKIDGGKLPGFNDHRMVMSEAIAIAGLDTNVEIWGAEAVNKSYPGFFEDYVTLGGCVKKF